MDAALLGSDQVESKTYKLQPNSELRVEVSADKDVVLVVRKRRADETNLKRQLQEGSAEIFGSELARGSRVSLRGQKAAVFTWQGCGLLLEGQPDLAYEATETPMTQYINVHHLLNNRRQAAREAGTGGPRCLLVGPQDSGKTTLCKTLMNWAIRSGWDTTYVDLDIGQGTITAPGCIAATPIEAPINIDEGYPVDVPLVYYYGHLSPQDNPDLYKFLVDRLAAVLSKRAVDSPEVAAAGMVVNSMGWTEGLGYELLVHVAEALQVDVVLVIDQDRLYNQLQAALSSPSGGGPPPSIVKVPKSGGVVSRTTLVRKDARNRQVKEYFYGLRGQLAPRSYRVPLTDTLKVFKIGGGPRAPSSALPLGATATADPLRVTPVPISNELMHSLLAVSHAQTPDQIPSSNVAGFILITAVDAVKGTVTYLAPSEGALPGKYLIAGTIKAFIEA